MCFHCSSNVLFLSLIFTNLIAEHLGVVLFELILFRTLCFLAMDVCFLYQMREVFSYYFFEYIPSPLISLFLGTPTMWMLVYMIFFQRSLKLFSFLLSFFFPVWPDFSITMSSSLLIHSYISSNILLVSSRVLFISVIIFFSIWFFYTFSKPVRKF